MVLTEGDAHWPVEFRPAPCGLGDGDTHWLDRYAWAWGARVRPRDNEYSELKWWVSLPDATVHEQGIPDVGEWFLTPIDFPEGTTPEDVDRTLVDDALEASRADGVHSDLSLTPTGDL